jgi:hypothetical protein
MITQQDLDDFLAAIELDLEIMIERLHGPEVVTGSELDNATTEAVATKVRVDSQPSYERTWEELRTIKFVEKEVNAKFDGLTKKADTVHKRAVAWRSFFLDRLADGMKKRKEAVAKYYEAMDRKWEERQRLLEAKAAGEVVDGEAPQAVIAPPTLEKMPGGSVSKLYRGRVDNLMELVKAVAEGKASIEYLAPNEAALNNEARARKSTMDIPGVTAVWEPSVRVNAWK